MNMELLVKRAELTDMERWMIDVMRSYSQGAYDHPRTAAALFFNLEERGLVRRESSTEPNSIRFVLTTLGWQLSKDINKKVESGTMDKLGRKRILREKVIQYFDKGAPSRNMDEDPVFEGFENNEVRQMVYALDEAGLIAKIRGSGPGTVYLTTDDGVILSKAMKLATKTD